MTKNSEKYPVELNDYECKLVLNNAMVFGQLKSTLIRMSKKEGIHAIQMSAYDINDIAGWMAAESNHAKSAIMSEELGNLCDHFENITYQIKRNALSTNMKIKS